MEKNPPAQVEKQARRRAKSHCNGKRNIMNEKEVAEIRRRFRPDKSNITHIRGCYVNDKREIVSQFDQSLALMPQEEAEKNPDCLKGLCRVRSARI